MNRLVLNLRARAWVLLGRPEAAEEAYDELLRLVPKDAHALASRSHLRAERGARAEAIADAQTLVDAHPARSAGDWFNLAFLLEADGRDAEAEAAFRRAVELDPKLDRAWYGLGLVLIRQQRHEEAVQALKRNTELQPMSPYGWYQLARVHIHRDEPEKARRIIARLKDFEPRVAAQLERETGLTA
jgi:tetratricopeptide (TPR) repeat protein